MLVTNIKVLITRNGNGAITYTKNKLNYKVLISKEDYTLKDIFDKYYNQLEQLKLRHYAIANWIARDIRKEGYIFKAYSSNNQNIRPIKNNNLIKVNSKEKYKQNIKGNLYRRKRKVEVSGIARLEY